jgi:hypothetical protein
MRSLLKLVLLQLKLSNGKALWQGTFQSARIGWKLVINVDVANKPAYKEG